MLFAFPLIPTGLVESPYLNKFGTKYFFFFFGSFQLSMNSLGTPKQATITGENGTLASGRIIVYPEFKDCLYRLEGFDYIWVLTLMHLNEGFKFRIKPMPRSDALKKPPGEVGLFSSRAPHRPNPIALSAIAITEVDFENGITFGIEDLTNH